MTPQQKHNLMIACGCGFLNQPGPDRESLHMPRHATPPDEMGEKRTCTIVHTP